MSQYFYHLFISWFQGIWAPDKQAKMVLLKTSFSRRYPRNQLLCAVLARAESNSLQANTTQSRKFKCPQIQNWLTLHWVGLCTGKHCAESNKYFRFSKISISLEFRIHLMIFKKKSNIFRKSIIGLQYIAQSWQLNFPKIQKWLTLPGVRLCAG